MVEVMARQPVECDNQSGGWSKGVHMSHPSRRLVSARGGLMTRPSEPDPTPGHAPGPGGGDVPDLDGAVQAAGGQRPAVGGEGHGENGVAVAVQGGPGPAAGDVPEINSAVEAAGGERPAVGGERQRQGLRRVAKAAQLKPRQQVGHADRLVVTQAGDQAAVGRKGDAFDWAVVGP